VYLEHFGLKEAPFRITPNTEYWYAGGQRGEILAALGYAISQGEGIIKVVGEVGSGKTMLCRMLAAKLPDTVDCVYLGNPTLAPDDMLSAILADLGVASPAEGRQARLAQLNQALLERHEWGRRVVVFVEEAQGISLDNLEFLRLLTNLETATDKLLQIVLFGQPELDVMLADPRIRQLKDRITLNLNLSPLNEKEVADYLRARLAVAGYRGPDLFPAPLVTRLTRLSVGLSRRINVLADKTLLAAYADQTHNIEARHLDAAAHDAETTSQHAPASRNARTWIGLVTGLAAGLGLLAFISWQAMGLTSKTEPAHTAAPLQPPSANKHVMPVVTAPDVTALASQTSRWLTTAAPGTYVIQLALAKDAASTAVLLGELNARPMPQPVRVLHGLSRGEAAWMILAGEFPDRKLATAALQKLPNQAPPSPFLRTVGKMQMVVIPSGSI
jgi:type II secretory pathway predicted ATPase ExeA